MDTREESAVSVARQRALGMSDDTIAFRLSISGTPREEIHSALQAPVPHVDMHPIARPESPLPVIQNTVTPVTPVITTRPYEEKKKGSSLIAGGLIAAALGAAAVPGYMLMKPPIVYSISLQGESATTTPITYGMMPALSDPDFYQRVKGEFIASHASFINADLSSMRLTVYEAGEVVLSVPILAKGKPGSWWETPVGIYRIETKEKNHFSSFGEVYMPWSMAFDGNFFIHGWPNYEDGTPVASSYSGGCIRLSNEDAQKVFELSAIGMPVLVYKAEDTRDAFQYSVQGPRTTAASYLVADIRNGTVLLSNNATSTLPIASLTKLITALVVIEHINLDKTVLITKEMLVDTTISRLKVGTSVSVHDLLILMLTESSNEAAEALAIHYGRSQFVDLMNKKAAAIGLDHTFFTDPAGFDVTDTSSPEELFSLLKYIYENRRFIFDITSNSLEHDAYGEVAFSPLENFNFIPNTQNAFIGGKIGKTDEALETYAGVFLFKIGSEERPVAVIALRSPDVQKDIAALLRSASAIYSKPR